MKKLTQDKIARIYLGIAPTTLSNRLCDNRNMSKKIAVHLSSFTPNISAEEWMFTKGEDLRKKLFEYFSEKHQEQQ
jgi:plasmid maintenance system antidote protein VapI